MNIPKLKENIITKEITYAGEKGHLELTPHVYSSADGELSIAEYVLKGLKGWDFTADEEPLPITLETLTTVIPSGLLTQIFDAILELKEAGMGKLKIVGK